MLGNLRAVRIEKHPIKLGCFWLSLKHAEDISQILWDAEGEKVAQIWQLEFFQLD